MRKKNKSIQIHNIVLIEIKIDKNKKKTKKNKNKHRSERCEFSEF